MSKSDTPTTVPLDGTVRPLVERLHDAAQGLSLGADGIGWSLDPALLREATDEIERLRSALSEMVAVEDLRGRVKAMPLCGEDLQPEIEYLHRKPLALAAARDALRPNV